MDNWKLLRVFTVPDTLPDGGVDEDGVYWTQMSSGGFMFGFNTDQDGKPFEAHEFLVRYNAGWSASSTGALDLSPVCPYEYGGRTYGANDAVIPKSGSRDYGWVLYKNVGVGWINYGTHNTGAAVTPIRGLRDVAASYTEMAKAIASNNGNRANYGFESGSTFEFWYR